MSDSFDDWDDWEEDPGLFSPGAPDIVDADSMALWLQGLLQDPLMDDDQ